MIGSRGYVLCASRKTRGCVLCGLCSVFQSTIDTIGRARHHPSIHPRLRLTFSPDLRSQSGVRLEHASIRILDLRSSYEQLTMMAVNRNEQ